MPSPLYIIFILFQKVKFFNSDEICLWKLLDLLAHIQKDNYNGYFKNMQETVSPIIQIIQPCHFEI